MACLLAGCSRTRTYSLEGPLELDLTPGADGILTVPFAEGGADLTLVVDHPEIKNPVVIKVENVEPTGLIVGLLLNKDESKHFGVIAKSNEEITVFKGPLAEFMSDYGACIHVVQDEGRDDFRCRIKIEMVNPNDKVSDLGKIYFHVRRYPIPAGAM